MFWNQGGASRFARFETATRHDIDKAVEAFFKRRNVGMAARLIAVGVLASFQAVWAAEDVNSKALPGSISGHIQAKEHSPLAGGVALALRLEYSGEQKRYAPVESAKIRADGSYSLRGLAAGTYYVVALPPETKSSGAEAAGALQPTYYPFSHSTDEAIPVVVAAGADTGAIDVTVSDEAVYAVCGQVVGFANETPEALHLTLMRLGPDAAVFGRRESRTAGANGHFCFQRVPAGDYVVQLQGSMTARMDVTVANSDAAGLRVLAGPAPRIEGFLHSVETLNRQDVYAGMSEPLVFYDGDKLLGVATNPNLALLPARSQAFNADQAVAIPGVNGNVDMRVCLVAADSFQTGRDPVCAQVQDKGRFALDAVQAGRYRIFTEDAPLGYFVKTVRYGGRDIAGGELEIGGGASGQLEILLSGDAVFVRGMATDGHAHAAPGTLVSLLPESDGQAFRDGPVVRTAVTGPDGRFAFWNLAPGTYLAWAWPKLDSPGLATQPALLRAFPSKAVRIEALNPADPGYVVQIDFVPRDEVARSAWR